jgi:hypothetical protein
MLKEYLEKNWFSIDDSDSGRKKYIKWINTVLFVGAGLLALSLLLYLILAIFSDRNTVISEYSDKVHEWKKRGEGNRLKDLSVAVKIMPSENTKGNMMIMQQKDEDLIKEEKIAANYNYSQSYYYVNDTEMYFPTFHYIREDVPVGDSEVFCVHIFWTPKENQNTLELYESVLNFPQCSKAANPRIIWKSHDPTHGIEVHSWTQNDLPMKGCNTRETCQKQCDPHNGIAKKTSTKEYVCYYYTVLTDICLLINYKGTEGWSYEGGCFEDGSPVRMIEAEPGKSYAFKNVRIQVRSALDPFVVAAKKSGGESGQFSLGADIDFLYTIAFILFFISIVCGVAVTAAVILREAVYVTDLYAKIFKSSLSNPEEETKYNH